MCFCCTSCLLSMDEDLQNYGNYVTPYAFKHIQDHEKLSEKVKVKEKLSEYTFVITKHDQTHVIVSPVSCQCNYPGRIGLPCRYVLKVRQLLGMSRFDKSLVLDRWKNVYANKGSKMDLSNIIGSDICYSSSNPYQPG